MFRLTFPLALVVSVGVLVAAPAAAEEAAAHERDDGLISLAWASAAEVEDAAALPGVSVVAPEWWTLRSDMVDGPPHLDRASVAAAQARDVAVWPVVGGPDDPAVTARLLRDARPRLVAAVVSSVENSGADGVVIDLPFVPASSASLLTRFVEEVADSLDERTVAVTVGPGTDDGNRSNDGLQRERGALGAAADYVILQAFDQHHELRRDGPVAALEWMEAVVADARRSVAPQQLLLGLALYVHEWAEDDAEPGGVRLAETMGMAAMDERLEQVEATPDMDGAAGQHRWEWSDADGRTRHAWQEDPDSLVRKTRLVEAAGLAGVAVWRVGLADAEAWAAIDRTLTASEGEPVADRLSGQPTLRQPGVPRPRPARAELVRPVSPDLLPDRQPPTEPTAPPPKPDSSGLNWLAWTALVTTAVAAAGALATQRHPVANDD